MIKSCNTQDNTLSSFLSPWPPPPDCCWPYNNRNIWRCNQNGWLQSQIPITY